MLPVHRKDRSRVTDPSKRRAPKQEAEIAARLGARTVRGSGSGLEKGDVRREGFLRVEAKCTRRKSFSLTRDMINKIVDAACARGDVEIPMMHIEFLSPDGKKEMGVYVLTEDDAESLLAGSQCEHCSKN